MAAALESTRYSTLDQINRENVQKLQVAWTFDTGDVFEGSEMQCNPIIVHGVLFATTPKLRVIALDAATGKQRCRFSDEPMACAITVIWVSSSSFHDPSSHSTPVTNAPPSCRLSMVAVTRSLSTPAAPRSRRRRRWWNGHRSPGSPAP